MNSTEDFSLYVHIPYCIKKCPYCDFNSYAIGESKESLEQENEYTEALLKELLYYSRLEAFEGRMLRSVFFGGGTPSLFSDAALSKILNVANKYFPVVSGAEITLEANPGTIYEELGRDKLFALRKAGFNRISLGAQSFSDEKLKSLGRIHLADDTKKAVENILVAGFSNFNLDLISGISGETFENWENELSVACNFAPQHISAYSLTIEPGTEFSRRFARGEKLQAEEGVLAELLTLTCNFLKGRGYTRYEISNYAIPGFESVHNLGYWSGRDYLGVGAGAHSFIRPQATTADEISWGQRWSNIPGPTHYIKRIIESGAASQLCETLSYDKAKIEFFYLGLRRSEGVSCADYRKRFGQDLNLNYAKALQELNKLQLINSTPENISLTEKGFLFTDSVLGYFVGD